LKGTSHGSFAPDVALMLRSPLCTPPPTSSCRAPIDADLRRSDSRRLSANVDMFFGGKGDLPSCGRPHRSCGSGTGKQKIVARVVTARQLVRLCIREPRGCRVRAVHHMRRWIEVLHFDALSTHPPRPDQKVTQIILYRRELDVGDGDGPVPSPPLHLFFLCI
jgi:hypothetical protein